MMSPRSGLNSLLSRFCVRSMASFMFEVTLGKWLGGMRDLGLEDDCFDDSYKGTGTRSLRGSKGFRV